MGTKAILTKYLSDKYKVTLTKDYIVFGIRGAKPDGDGNDLVNTKQEFNIFDDTLGFINIDECQVFLGTVDPGKYYTDNPMNKNGCFHLNNGLWVMVKATHMGKPAFHYPNPQPDGKPLLGWRDTNRNGKDEERNIIAKDATGVDCHAMDRVTIIGAGSAGCQGVANGWNGKEWKTFKETLYASKQRSYLYCLLDFSELDKYYKE